MLTHAPLPAWSTLMRALFLRPPSDDLLASHWRRDGELAGWLSRSAWSLALISLWRKQRTSKAEIIAWIPDFFCNSSLVPLRGAGTKLVFYPLTDQLAPDISVCRMMAQNGAPDLFLLVHYFGQPAPAAAVREFCSRHDAWLVEDAAHVLRPVDGVGQSGDFVLYSPHKLLPIPDGAVLVVRGEESNGWRDALGPPASWPGQLSELQQQLGGVVRDRRSPPLVWLAKRILQKLGVHRSSGGNAPFVEALNGRSDVSARLPTPSASALARRLLGGLTGELGAESWRRQRHQLLWDALLVGDEPTAGDLSPAARPLHREWTPYLAAYEGCQNVAQATHERWQRQGLPVTTWPDLPPEAVAQREGTHASAWRERHRRFYLPVHRGLGMKAMVKRTRPNGEAKHGARSTAVWDGATRAQWQEWLAQAGRSNLLQSWSYGEAKADASGWEVTRGVFYTGDKPVAIAQVLRRRLGLRISRINRGPLFLRAPNPEEQRAVWVELSSLGDLRRGGVLSAAPELPLTGRTLSLMAGLGFRQSGISGHESAWIDLSLELDALRRQLNGKWRNMLVSAEKSGLELESGSDDSRVEWMLHQYEELKNDAKFTGPPAALLRKLQGHCTAEEKLVILCAVHEGERVAGVCISRHGSAATYLLGWNGPKGRTLKANQYLLWQAVVYLKHCGTRWFDLGGISDEDTPGVAAFKRGLNGERYELVGEYWRW